MVWMASIGQWWMLVFLVMFMGPLMRLIFYPSRYWRDRGRWGSRWGRYLDRDREREAELEAMSAELQTRMAQIDSLESRVLELESRLDFAERLLAKPAVSQEAARGTESERAHPAIV